LKDKSCVKILYLRNEIVLFERQVFKIGRSNECGHVLEPVMP